MRKLLPAFVVLACCLLSQLAFAQDRTVTGKVSDANGIGIPGATVTVKGTLTATSTASDGSFSITAPASANTLVISSVGFAQLEVPIGNSPVNVSMQTATSNLSEVVVVGYGTQRRRDVTGAISKVSADKIANVPAPSFESALAGKAAGVQVITSGGAAGSGAIIRIRGINSISVPGDPLYVIDGLPIDATYLNGPMRNNLGQDRNPLANINPNDIESIEILKDAGAAGIYGSRGANGVILITTKKGRGNKLRINFDARVGISMPAVKPDYVDKDTWLKIRQEAWELDGNTGLQQNLPGKSGGFPLDQAMNNPGTDWWDLATRTGFNHNYNISFSKGLGKISSYVGLNYSDEHSYIVGNEYQRMGAIANIDYRALDNLTISLKGQVNGGLNHVLNNAWNGGLGLAMGPGLPYYPVYNPDGSYFITDYGSGTTWDDLTGRNNLVYQRENSDYRNKEMRYIGGASVVYRPVTGLSLSVQGQYENNNSTFNGYKTAYLLNRPNPASRQGNAENNLSKYTNVWLNSTATYDWRPNDNNRFSFLLGAEYQDQETRNQYVYLDSAMSPIYDGGKTEEFKTRKANEPYRTTFQKRFQSFMGRVNYSLMNKYMLQATLRRDASSVFRENNRFAYFPTISGGWIISDENFLANIKAINFLKLRASWGLTGSSNIPWNAGYPSVDTSRQSGTNYAGEPSIFRTQLGNPDLKWETTDNLDLAIEYGLFNNRISGEVAWYRKTTRDLLLEVPIVLANGIEGNQWQNRGSVLNQGIEFTINSINYQTANFRWSTNFNISHVYNEVLDIGGLRPDAIGGGTNETRVVPGYPIGTIFTVRYYGVDPADGLPIFLDKDGKKTKVLNLASWGGDKVPVASNIPDFTGGLTNTFRYKDFELNTLLTFQKGGSIWDNSGKRSLGFITDWNIYAFYVGNYWRKPGDIAKYPRPTLSGYPGSEGNAWNTSSSMTVFDADFLRLKELTLNYYLPERMIRKWKLSTAKVFFTGYNLLLFTKYPVGDPEGGRDGENDAARNQSPNANFLNLPQQKSFNFGLSLSF